MKEMCSISVEPIPIPRLVDRPFTSPQPGPALCPRQGFTPAENATPAATKILSPRQASSLRRAARQILVSRTPENTVGTMRSQGTRDGT